MPPYCTYSGVFTTSCWSRRNRIAARTDCCRGRSRSRMGRKCSSTTMVPRISRRAATVFTDAVVLGFRKGATSPQCRVHTAQLQTAEDRSKLVYRVNIAVDNRNGV